MRRIAQAVISGMVMSVSDKPGDPAKDKKPYRLVKLSQLGDKGDADLVEVKVYNGAKIEVGKVQNLTCSLQAWMMKGDRGDMMYGLTATLLESK